MTPIERDRLARQWMAFTQGEPIRVEGSRTRAYAYGSELACLRLIYKFRNVLGADIGYSREHGHYFVLDQSQPQLRDRVDDAHVHAELRNDLEH